MKVSQLKEHLIAEHPSLRAGTGVVYVIDVGSPSEGLAWARLAVAPSAPATGSNDLPAAARRIVADLKANEGVAIGFEAPGCIPVPFDPQHLGKARNGEVRGDVSRPWSYGAGAYVTTMAMHIGAWLLREVRSEFDDFSLPRLTLDPTAWLERKAQLLLWEAFISGPGHARSANEHGVSEHIQDAATAAIAFRAWLSANPRMPSAVTCESGLSTLGAIAVWSRWCHDINMLAQEPFVLWPSEPFGQHVVLDCWTPPNPNVEPRTEGNSPPPEPGIVLCVQCGDSHSVWRNHQQTEEQATDFARLMELLSDLPREFQTRFADGAWRRLKLRRASDIQMCWSAYNAEASAADRIEMQVYVPHDVSESGAPQ